VTAAQAVVTEAQFPPKTTADLVALCSETRNDAMTAAALSYCHGYFEGAVEVALGYEAVSPPSHEPFCLPSPRPTNNEAVTRFVSWANADPRRLDEPALVGLLSYLTQQYPCLHPSVAAVRREPGSRPKKEPHA
jgi:hypothetical protein